MDGENGGRESAEEQRRQWLTYYSRKRIIQQWTQLALLGSVECRRVLEIGPARGLVTAMLVNAGYEVGTLDYCRPAFTNPIVPHIIADLREVKPQEIAGYDAILCCETLEHIEWETVGRILETLRHSGARYLVISVPYMETQLTFDLYVNPHVARHYFSLKKLTNRRSFTPGPRGEHQWEVGYRGYSLQAWEQRLTNAGWLIRQRDFTEHCRSVFHILEASPAGRVIG